MYRGVAKMECYKKVFFGEKIKEEKKEELLEKIKNNENHIDVLMVTTNKKSSELFEIVHSHKLTKPMYMTNDFKVIGVAKNKKDCDKLVKLILEDYMTTGYDIMHIRKKIITDRIYD